MSSLPPTCFCIKKANQNQATLYRRKNDVQIWLKQVLEAIKYPKPHGKTYLVVEIEPETEPAWKLWASAWAA